MKTANTLAIAAIFITLPWSLHGQSTKMKNQSNPPAVKSMTSGDTSGSSAGDSTSAAPSEARIPARVTLVSAIDAKKDQPGQEVKAKLVNKVHLEDGTELPAGTLLIGEIAQDDLNMNGKAKLALQFTHATLKDGKTVAIKATILSANAPQSTDSQGNSQWAGDDTTGTDWNSKAAKVNQIGAFDDVDLHSTITSKNSGVFVSTDKNDIKLKAGSEMELAIASVK